MSGQDILIEQLRAEVERLRDDRADLQERCNRLTGERNAALRLVMDEEARADRAESSLAAAAMCDPGDCGRCVACLVRRAEKAERERDEERHLADVRGEMLAKAERERDAYKRAKEENDDRFMRERDEARAERDARPDISAEDALAYLGSASGRPTNTKAAFRTIEALRAHAAKAVKP